MTMYLYNIINLVHNFMVNAQDIFTFGRRLLFTVSFTEIKQVLMQIMIRFIPSY